MFILRCAVCKATNEFTAEGPHTCRRCKADLSLLAAAHLTRQHHLAVATSALRVRNLVDARAALQHAEAIQPGVDVAQLRACVALIARDFATALQQHRLASEQP